MHQKIQSRIYLLTEAASRKQQRPWLGLDWIEGGIANDRVISTVDAYTDGYMTAEMAMDKLINETLRHQGCILNQEIINILPL